MSDPKCEYFLQHGLISILQFAVNGDAKTVTRPTRDLKWDAVRVFLNIARSGSLRGAAERESVNHATVARALGALERDLGARLFERSRLGLQLTQAGEELIQSAEKMEQEARSIQRRISGRDERPSGRVTVSVPPLLAYCFLAEHFARFSALYPEIDLDVKITNAFADLLLRETDVSIRIAYDVDDDVVGRRLIQYKRAVYGSHQYFQDRPDLTAGDGREASWIGWSDDGATPAWVKESDFPKAQVKHIMPEAVLHIEAAANHMGITYLPCFIGDSDPRLARAPGTQPADDRSLWLLLHGDLRKTARVRAFVDFMAEAIRGQLPLIRGEAA